jgi:uncharacterized membrane protein YjgN (DUF898 family)
MKNYFQFNLEGKKLFPVWLALIFLFGIPYFFVQFKIQELSKTVDPTMPFQNLGMTMAWNGVMVLLLIVEYAIMFYFQKLIITHIKYKETALAFSGSFGKYLWLLVSGAFLTIITFGIYFPWFMTKIIRFFSGNTAYKDEPFEFRGKGVELFVIILCIILPVVFIAIIAGIIAAVANMTGSVQVGSPSPFVTLFPPVLMFLILAPCLYYIYKWMIHFSYKNYFIRFRYPNNAWHSIGKIALEIFLSIITVGIYMPLAMLKLYKYFAELTVTQSETTCKTFGYELEAGEDFLYIWGQILLTIVTIGFYYPWTYCKVMNRVLGKTFVEE